ncbi:hypothetical protein COU58_01290 [Candidatus Pacearchaeota archaeon CG10_big_fil_rev_8_21_14_0_10_32_42]|nr:MAG: hypothetical protein COU58_01290 [Candidatus Pacearchaeota archaeon CG10_big_fil_rev_8_21_14_0_10_32_42]
MPEIKSLLYSLLISALIFYGCKDLSKNKEKKFKKESNIEKIESYPYPEIYDSLKNKFIEKPKGIEEKLINENMIHLDKNEFWKYKIIDSVENFSKFRNFEENEGIFSQFGTMVMMINNFKTIKKVDKANLEDLKEEYIPLKNLIERLDSIYVKNKKNLNYLGLKEMYEEIGKGIEPNEENASIPIQEVVSGRGGVCRDLVSTYYPLLNYYGFDIGFNFGSSENSGHIWLAVNLGEKNFELDPSWYGNNMIPLEMRVKKDFNYNSLKKEFTTQKN